MRYFNLQHLCLVAISMISMKNDLLADTDLFFRNTQSLVPTTGKANGITANDLPLSKRIIDAYKLALNVDIARGQSCWQVIFDVHQAPVHKVFLKRSLADSAAILRNPGCCDMFYGIDNLMSLSLNQFAAHPKSADDYVAICLDRLVRFAEAIGAIRLFNPENVSPAAWRADDVIHRIEQKLECSISFPNPYPNEYGVITPRGIACVQAIQGLYQAWRMKQLLQGIEHPRVLEIGAGVGRTAYYARMFGIEDYTIIDIPFTSTCSGYFLGRTLGEDQILLFGETSQNAGNLVKILPPSAFFDSNEHYDLIINVDSLTEIDPSIALAYWNHIAKSTNLFVSINHEINPFTVNELILKSAHKVEAIRYPYWMRKGYVEEIIRFK